MRDVPREVFAEASPIGELKWRCGSPEGAYAIDRGASFLHIALGTPASHHYGNVGYDFAKAVTLNGTAATFDWPKPYCLLHLDVRDDSGKVQRWTIEMSTPTILSRHGWTKDLFKAFFTVHAWAWAQTVGKTPLRRQSVTPITMLSKRTFDMWARDPIPLWLSLLSQLTGSTPR